MAQPRRIEHVFDEEPKPRRGLPTAVLAAWVDTLAGLERAVDDAERIDQIALLERLKAASAAAQARVTADLAAGQRRILAETGVDRAGQARSIGAQVALARRESPVRGNRHLGVAEALVHEMPATFAALQRGDLSEWRATVLVRETACLSRSDRTLVDAELGPRLPELGDKQVADESRKIAYRLDPPSVMRRIRGAESDRRVQRPRSLRELQLRQAGARVVGTTGSARNGQDHHSDRSRVHERRPTAASPGTTAARARRSTAGAARARRGPHRPGARPRRGLTARSALSR
jgi:hypothetical protein